MEYICPKCNAVLTLVTNNKFRCSYCRSNYNYDDLKQIDIQISAEFIIPFEINKDYAIKEYKKLIKSRILTPKEFKSNNSINKIEKIYIPCYVYDFESTGIVEYDGNKVSSWKSGGKNYKKIDVYKITRGGSMSLERVPIIGSKALQDNIIDLVGPYDYKKLNKLDIKNIENYKIYNFDNTKEELINKAIDKAKKCFIMEMKKSIKDYVDVKANNNSINLYNTRTNSVLLPIYMLNINYKNKDYIYIINGQTGKINGYVRTNKKIAIYLWIMLFILVFSISLFVNWLVIL